MSGLEVNVGTASLEAFPWTVELGLGEAIVSAKSE